MGFLCVQIYISESVSFLSFIHGYFFSFDHLFFLFWFIFILPNLGSNC